MKEINKELLAAALQCNNTDELIELAKSNGYEITQEKAESFLEQNSSRELSDKELDDVSGGWEDHSSDDKYSTIRK